MDAWMDTRKRSLVGANQRSVNGVKKRWVTSTLRDIAEGCWVVSLTSSFSSLSRCLDVFNDHHINERKGSSRETSNMMKFTFQNICTEFGWFINWMIVMGSWVAVYRKNDKVRSFVDAFKRKRTVCHHPIEANSVHVHRHDRWEWVRNSVFALENGFLSMISSVQRLKGTSLLFDHLYMSWLSPVILQLDEDDIFQPIHRGALSRGISTLRFQPMLHCFVSLFEDRSIDIAEVLAWIDWISKVSGQRDIVWWLLNYSAHFFNSGFCLLE